MATYAELIAQAAALMEQAEALRKEEKTAAIQQIRDIACEFDLTPEDLGFGPRKRKASRSAGEKSSLPVKFRSPFGQQWSGRGRKPAWLAMALAQGANLEDYRVKAEV